MYRVIRSGSGTQSTNFQYRDKLPNSPKRYIFGDLHHVTTHCTNNIGAARVKVTSSISSIHNFTPDPMTVSGYADVVSRAGLTIVPVVPWDGAPPPGGTRSTANFYHAVLTFERLNVQRSVYRLKRNDD